MIISRTPFRISFFGGGTDYPIWYKKNGGAVIATSIDKYCYISCRQLPPFFEHKHRIVYGVQEKVRKIDDIDHPAVREILKYMKVKKGLEVHYDGDLPARAGLGTSSSFSVGLLKALYGLKGKIIAKRQLALDAINIEQNIIKENVGSQDQVTAAFGGLNKIEFNGEEEFIVHPITITKEKYDNLQKNLMLFFTGFSRTASEIASEQIRKTPKRKEELQKMRSMVDDAIDILNHDSTDLKDFGKLLHESWQIKRKLTDKITTPEIDKIYEKARKAGAVGGKILGAGGGGFILFFVESDKQNNVKEKLNDLLHVPFKFEELGSQIVYYTRGEEEI